MKLGVGKCGRYNVGKDYVCAKGPGYSWTELKNLLQEAESPRLQSLYNHSLRLLFFVRQFDRIFFLETSNIPTKLIGYVKKHNRRKAATQSQRSGFIP